MSSHDVFICHASEDKDAVARPLAELLRKLGLEVWFDEYSLDVGDSLSRSIDQGLATSRFGVVILSPSFFSKNWPQHELSGLVAKEMAYGKTILPIWHNITADGVRAVSPTLADKVAICTSSFSVKQMGRRILKVVRPDIFENLHRWILWRSILAKAQPSSTPIADLKQGPIRYPTLPPSLVVRIRVVHSVLGEASELDLEQMIDSFSRDVEPSREVEVWERIASSYLAVVGSESLPEPERGTLFATLLNISFLDAAALDRISRSSDKLTQLALDAWLKVGTHDAPTDNT
jgi:hypothetical protein